MLVVVENNVEKNEDVGEEEEMEIGDGIEMGKEKGRETVRDRSTKTELGTTSGTSTAAGTETVTGKGTGAGAEVSTGKQHVPQGIFRNQGSKISLYVQKETPGPDKRAHNVSGLFYRLCRNTSPLFSHVFYLMFLPNNVYMYPFIPIPIHCTCNILYILFFSVTSRHPKLSITNSIISSHRHDTSEIKPLLFFSQFLVRMKLCVAIVVVMCACVWSVFHEGKKSISVSTLLAPQASERIALSRTDRQRLYGQSGQSSGLRYNDGYDVQDLWGHNGGVGVG